MKRRNFIKNAGGYMLFLPSLKIIDKIGFKKKDFYDKDLKAKCIAAFNRFEQVWEFNDFWKRGNTFDACLNFTDALHTKWPDDPAVRSIQHKVDGMLKKNLAYFKSFDSGAMWADDFGWWGLMGINARKHLLRSGNQALADQYLLLSTDGCWKQERDHAYDFSNTAKPVPHGCSNGDANGNNKGAKNTVTNVLFFLLSVKLYRLMAEESKDEREKYLEMAYHQWNWFDSWFQLSQYDYLKRTTSGGALVQERPTAFFEGSGYTEISHPTWEKGWLWTGDQGMLLSALQNLLAVKNDLAKWIIKNNAETDFNADAFANRVNDYVALISKGVKTALFSNADHIIREAPFKSNMGPEFGNDYLAGRGILMRYLGTFNGSIANISFRNNITDTVDAIWQTRDTSSNQFSPEFTIAANDELFIQQFKKQWGLADDIVKWDIANMNEQQKFGVCQSIGLDALGAVLRNNESK